MAYEFQWKLGEDMSTDDNILDPITFDDIILSVKCDCKNITISSVLQKFSELLEMRVEDAREILTNNLSEIAEATLLKRNIK